jgi:hypothetical protein
MDDLVSYIPLSAEIPDGFWPEALIDSREGKLLDLIAFEEGDLVGTEDEWGILARLRAIEELVFDLPLLKAISLVLGKGSVVAEVEGDNSGSWTAAITADLLKVRFARELLKPVIDRNGQLVADPNESSFVEIKLPLTLQFNNSGEVDLIWAGEEEQPFQLPKCELIPGTFLEGNLKITFENGVLKAPDSSINRSNANGETVALTLEEFYLDKNCFAMRWQEPDINYWLKQLIPNFQDNGEQLPSITTFRILFGDDLKSQEIRLDWEFKPNARILTLPGVTVTTPESIKFSLVFYKDDLNKNNLNLLSLVMTWTSGSLNVASNFAWTRDTQRELQNDIIPQVSPLFEISLTPPDQTPSQPVSLVLARFNTDDLTKLPHFFYQLDSAIQPLVFADVENSLKQSTNLSFLRRFKNGWKGNFKLNVDNSFTFPFLNNDSQFIKIKPRGNLEFTPPEIKLIVDVEIKIGNLSFETFFEFDFDWEKFALRVDHSKGIDLFSKTEIFTPKEYLGLVWRFKGKYIDKDKYHFFTLATQDFNYQLQLAPGAEIEIDFSRATKANEPITFLIRDFALTPKGLNLEAIVTDRPATLNGIDTQFRFNGSSFRIVENNIQDFTLMGAGPLPPALVGEATVDIALEFAQRNGNLDLIAGCAKLKSNQLLYSRSTRFQFSVDAIGLKFVSDNGNFHLYFTLTGSTRYSPAPGDGSDFALALLSAIKIDLIECPLTGDARIISKSVKFLIELPRPVSFSFFGCFDMELRAIGFLPQADVFGGDAAMDLTGQLKFVQGAGDTPDSRPDFHRLLIGIPSPGDLLPRVYLKELPVNINFGAAFKLNGSVAFYNELDKQGFDGEGTLEIQGLPTFSASFSFVRVRDNESSPWLRAWFIFLQVEKVSFQIPVVTLFIREVGLGFGYRYTLSSIKAADRTNDVRALLKDLQALSRTQGDLSKRDRWAVDFEKPGEDPRWTVVLRALISQTTAATSPLQWNEQSEKELACTFLFDAVIALRSDLTFFMAARVWLNTNYYDYYTNGEGKAQIKNSPLFSGFVLLSPRQKRLLAHVASNPNGFLGNRPELPPLIQKAIRGGQFSATLLIEPGLLHYELGWPNMLRWKGELEALQVDIRGGFIFRVTKDELVIGSSYQATGTLDIKADVDLGIVGCRVSAFAQVSYGARFIAALKLRPPYDTPAVIYGAIGLDVQIDLSVEFWICIDLGWFGSWEDSASFSKRIGFTAGLELGIVGSDIGLRGSGTISVSCFGHDITLTANLGFNEGSINKARERTNKYLRLGLEATDVEPAPGINSVVAFDSLNTRSINAGDGVPLDLEPITIDLSPYSDVVNAIAEPTEVIAFVEEFSIPDYLIFTILDAQDKDGWRYFTILPQGTRKREDGSQEQEQGFLPVPPADVASLTNDFEFIDLPTSRPDEFELQHFDPTSTDPTGNWRPVNSSPAWKVNWNQIIREVKYATKTKKLTLREYLSYAYRTQLPVNGTVADSENPPTPVPERDPDPLPNFSVTYKDDRVNNPSENAFETAVRGAVNQFQSSPLFKRDLNQEYDQILNNAFQPNTTIYDPSGQVPETAQEKLEFLSNQQAWQLRGQVINNIIKDVREYAGKAPDSVDRSNDTNWLNQSIPFQMGLVFRFKGNIPEWLMSNKGDSRIQIKQRRNTASSNADSDPKSVRVFNTEETSFGKTPPKCNNIVHYTDATTIAIAWDLDWTLNKEGMLPSQSDPEHHLAYYEVRRRALDGSEPERFYTRKSCQVLDYKPKFKIFPSTLAKLQEIRNKYADRTTHWSDAVLTGLEKFSNDIKLESKELQDFILKLEENEDLKDALKNIPPNNLDLKTAILRFSVSDEKKILRRLQTRFQIVDRFNESISQRIALPTEGRSYLYTITPVDFAGNQGRPITLVATRRPTEPPLVPVNGELIVTYELNINYDFMPAFTVQNEAKIPELIIPNVITVEWSDPIPHQGEVTVPIDKYFLVFRKEETLPIGSYGLDSTTQRSRTKSLPTTNARILSTDVELEINKVEIDRSQSIKKASLKIDHLKDTGVFPRETVPLWRPEAWRVFLQTESPNGVRSALAPVQLLMRFEPNSPSPEEDREERRPAELEWIPKPIQFSLLPPEDLKADKGNAFFPMPTVTTDSVPHFDDILNEDGTLKNISYQSHPKGISLVRFQWNQAPSDDFNYPCSLNAAFSIWELDIDNHTKKIFQDPSLLASVLRPIQTVQLQPSEDLLLTPSDTLATSQWEAWYPSTLLRRREKATGEEVPYGSWYSWRDSYLKWPEWSIDPTMTPTGQLHPLLQKIIEKLEKSYKVDLQIRPPLQPSSFEEFQLATSSKSDPYGWGILQRLGLSFTFTLYQDVSENFNKDAGNLIDNQDTLSALHNVLGELASEEPLWNSLFDHLFIELLFQPGKIVQLETGIVKSDSLLAITQVSLRPVVQSYLKYSEVKLSGVAGQIINLEIKLSENNSCSIINQSDLASGQVEIPAQTSKQTIPQQITLPFNGQTTILLRSQEIPNVTQVVLLQKAPARQSLPKDYFTYQPSGPKRLIIKEAFYALTELKQQEKMQVLQSALKPVDRIQVQLSGFEVREFLATDNRSSYFNTPLEDLKNKVTQQVNELLAKAKSREECPLAWEWLKFKHYAEATYNPDLNVAQFTVPVDPKEIKKILPDFLLWTQRFFDASDAVASLSKNKPWLVTAYPRTTATAYSTPDSNGSLTYDHLLEDKWGHNYRYYIQPSGRYDLLWQSLSKSPVFASTIGQIPSGKPDPKDNGLQQDSPGLDVVLERTYPIAAPLVLRSGRLDLPSQPESPAKPGNIWEVIIAQHPEQTLIERNQTLARQLSFRQVAFTLLRRFAKKDNTSYLEAAVSIPENPPYQITIDLVENNIPSISTTYPETPEHLTLPPAKDKDEQQAIWNLNLPARIGSFQQGAMVLNWEALPYYYECRLLVIAQTTREVSKITEVTQRDFEYISPNPTAIVLAAELPTTERYRRLQVPLKRFWDCLPKSAQEQWVAEVPLEKKDTSETNRRYSSLPDLDVIYQIQTENQGNLEVQAQVLFDKSNNQYVLRQLGQVFELGLNDRLQPPPVGQPQADFLLNLELKQINRQSLQNTYDLALLDESTKRKVSIEGQNLIVSSVFTDVDRNNLLVTVTLINDADNASKSAFLAAIEELVRNNFINDEPLISLFSVKATREKVFLDCQSLNSLSQKWLEPDWFHQEPISHKLDLEQLPPELKEVVNFPEVNDCTLVWSGKMSELQRNKLGEIQADDPFKNALKKLADATTMVDDNDYTRITNISPGLEQLPTRLTNPLNLTGNQLTFSFSPGSPRQYTALSWKGLLFDEHIQGLKDWTSIDEFSKAIDALAIKFEQVSIDEPVVPPRPLPSELPFELQGRLVIDSTQLSWIAPKPTNSQLNLLSALQADTEFSEALTQLLADVTTPVSLSPLPQRPRQKDLPNTLRSQLVIEPTTIRWRERIRNNVQLEALKNLAPLGDAPFNTTLVKIITNLESKEIEQKFELPTRPEPEDLADELKEQLLIGRSQIRYHGLMTVAEGKALQALSGLEPDKKAIQRLHDASLKSGLNGAEIKIGAQLGSADPQISLLQPQSLSEENAGVQP